MGAMNVWFTADLHLGHTNIVGYCGRPYRSAEDMDASLVALWNATVAPRDEVWVLGDVAMGRIADSLALVRLLNGTKRLVAGNHDRCFEAPRGRAKAARSEDSYLDAGFTEVAHGTLSVEVEGRRVLACHFPFEGDSHGQDRYVEHRPRDDGCAWLLHGHVHDSYLQRGRMINVGVDAWAGRPVSATTLAGVIDGGPADRAPLAWVAPAQPD